MTTPISHPFYLDCDTGIDDALALAYLLASPQADLRGIGTVSGNVSAAVGARNTLDLLQLAGHAHIPVALGAHDPQAGTFHGGAPHVHGANGIGEVSLEAADAELVPGTAAEMLVRLAHEHPGQLRILAVGPLTNIAEALRLDPELPRLVQDITIMGGAAFAPGNITARGRGQHRQRPRSRRGRVRRRLGRDPGAAGRHHVQRARGEPPAGTARRSGHPVPQALGEMLGYYFRFYESQFGRACSAMHDPLAAALAVGGVSAAVAPVVTVDVDTTDGPGRGQTICDLRGRYMDYPEQPGARCRVVLELDGDFAPHLVEVLQSVL